VFVSGGRAITWRSKKLTTVTLTEAEYIALPEASHEACWLRNLYEELGVKINPPVLINRDNNGSAAMEKIPSSINKPNIATCWHWVRDMVDDKVIDMKSCCDPDQMADILTKVSMSKA
jgi:hypothetical protein